jgi:hypothetical protein
MQHRTFVGAGSLAAGLTCVDPGLAHTASLRLRDNAPAASARVSRGLNVTHD